MRHLEQLLQQTDHKSYPAYKSLQGSYRFPAYTLSIDHVQGDPFAAPSRLSVTVPGKVAGMPAEDLTPPHRRVALEDALYLADLAKQVYLIHRRDSFRGEETNAARLMERENVEFVYNSNVTRLIAEKRLKAIEGTNKLDGSVRTIELNGLFIAVGRVPENQNFAEIGRAHV